MTKINVKSLFISSAAVWIVSYLTLTASYAMPLMKDPVLQGSWLLSIILIPFSFLGAHLYYRKGHKTNGFLLGAMMFLVYLLLDVLVTVPTLIGPFDANAYMAFFANFNYWFLGLELIAIVAVFWQFKVGLFENEDPNFQNL
ncbi:MAG: hypothetical protein AAGI38_16695 [Bacteroidota bacterium]